MNTITCILCRNEETDFFHEDHSRSYFKCPDCHLVFVSPDQHLSPEEEKKRYDHHENSLDDDHYRNFLRRLFDPMQKRIAPQSEGLDFGSGPGPTLHLMFAEAGHDMNIYDIYYADDPAVFDQMYDFITATEVVEHLHQPRKELDRLWDCLKPDGLLGIMTKQIPGKSAFRDWHYIRDDTHVAFFSKPAFKWMAKRWQANLSFEENDVVIFQKIKEFSQKNSHHR